MPDSARSAGASTIESFAELPMRVGVGQTRDLEEKRLRFLAQLGVEDLLISSLESLPSNDLEPGEPWPFDELLLVRNRVEDAGLRLVGFEHMPVGTYDLLLDDEGRAEKIETVAESIRNMGRAGIPILGYSGHHPERVWRTSHTARVRGGAQTYAFDAEQVAEAPPTLDYEVTEDELWDAYEVFLEAIVPAAEESGVRVGLHPSDPPVEEVAGIPLLFRNRENFEKALSLVPSENHGLKLCLGCWSEMGEDLPDVIRHFGEQIFYVHFRNTIGSLPEFTETFVDDPDGYFDPYEVISALDEVGFSGVMTPDHVPRLDDDPDWGAGGYIGRAFTFGYLKALIHAVGHE